MKSNTLNITAVFALILCIGMPAAYADSKVKYCSNKVNQKTPCLLDSSTNNNVFYATGGVCTIQALSSGAQHYSSKCTQCKPTEPADLAEGSTILLPPPNEWGIYDGFSGLGSVNAFRGTFKVISCRSTDN